VFELSWYFDVTRIEVLACRLTAIVWANSEFLV